jgi:hypothetical protein
MRMHPPAQDYIARRLSEGKTKREAIRCLKRHLVHTVFSTMTTTSGNAPAPALALTEEQPMRVSAQTLEAAPLILGTALLDRLIATAVGRFPTKTFGYLLGRDDPLQPADFVVFRENLRNDGRWRKRFEAYGRYFVDHSDAGFVASPQEAWEMQQEIARRDLVEVGVFHTHQRHPANFSRIDFEMHWRLFESLYHVILSLRNPSFPRLRAFQVSAEGVCELEVLLTDVSLERRQC